MPTIYNPDVPVSEQLEKKSAYSTTVDLLGIPYLIETATFEPLLIKDEAYNLSVSNFNSLAKVCFTVKRDNGELVKKDILAEDIDDFIRKLYNGTLDLSVAGREGVEVEPSVTTMQSTLSPMRDETPTAAAPYTGFFQRQEIPVGLRPTMDRIARNVKLSAAEVFHLYQNDSQGYKRLEYLDMYILNHFSDINPHVALSREEALATTEQECFNLVTAYPFILDHYLSIGDARALSEEERCMLLGVGSAEINAETFARFQAYRLAGTRP